MNSKAIAGIIIAVIIVAGGITWYMVAHSQSQSASAATATYNQGQPGYPGGMGQGVNGSGGQMASSTGRYRGMMANVPAGGFAAGTITAIGSDSITITQRDNTSKTIDVDSNTMFKTYDASSASMVAATLSDLAVGQRIIAIGTPNTDGSVQATMVDEGMPMRQRMMASSTPPVPATAQ